MRQVVGLGEDELSAVEAVFPLVSSGAGSSPAIMRIDVPENHGEIDIKSAYLPGYPGIAVKVSAGFFDNPSKGLPSLGGLMMVLDAGTGVPRSALFDNGYLTDIRTALAGAVAARHLAREDAGRAGIVGAGVQARLQLEALTLVRDLTQATVWARREEKAAAYASEMSEKLGIPVDVSATVDDLVGVSDIVVTTTPSTEPLIEAAMFHPGLHITAVGSDAEHKQELSADVVTAADRFVCDRIAQSSRLGELRSAVEAGFDESVAVELGAVIAGAVRGRLSEDDVTVCDLTGTGAQDTAIASLATERCAARGLGTTIAT
ncbi:MAG TPA: cyclodeaminase [Acidimicrobiia bacterium]|nr:cyclodeaminase [Acidimicrobiia bacterium]